MPKKIFIISFNGLTTNFWKQHLNLENVQLWHWSAPEHAFNNLTTVWPDVIIIDGYWSHTCYETYLNKVLKIRSKAKIFCTTPQSNLSSPTIFIDQRLKISRFDENFIETVNQIIQPEKSIIEFKQTA